ncbi:MAG TPA: SDR family oxidoreductase [Caulobacteraceae bacterium]|jgi:3-oxoacyl-[acyl-carrier protein] reductase|nr:SDR family oxidoreductase [Caulobacteraceae bacterium]
MGFEGQVAFVTGGGAGIGAAVARRFAQGGAAVVIADVKGDIAAATAAAIRDEGLAAEGVELDVTDEVALEACVAGIVARHGGLDHAVASAGIASRHTIPQMPVETWRRVIDVNLTGAFLTTKFAQGPIAARGGGSITVISSVAAEHVAYLSGVHYAASKTALVGMVRHAAFELGRKGIRVNALGPGPMSNRMGGGVSDPARRAAAARNVPLQRVVEPEDLGEVCAFLASRGGRAITGVYLPVDCGFLTGRGVNYRGYFDAHDEAF